MASPQMKVYVYDVTYNCKIKKHFEECTTAEDAIRFQIEYGNQKEVTLVSTLEEADIAFVPVYAASIWKRKIHARSGRSLCRIQWPP